MHKFEDNPFDGELEVIATLRDRAIQAAAEQEITRDDLVAALQYGLSQGISVDALSSASGFTPEQIRGLDKAPIS